MGPTALRGQRQSSNGGDSRKSDKSRELVAGLWRGGRELRRTGGAGSFNAPDTLAFDGREQEPGAIKIMETRVWTHRSPAERLPEQARQRNSRMRAAGPPGDAVCVERPRWPSAKERRGHPTERRRFRQVVPRKDRVETRRGGPWTAGRRAGVCLFHRTAVTSARRTGSAPFAVDFETPASVLARTSPGTGSGGRACPSLEMTRIFGVRGVRQDSAPGKEA